MLTLGGVVLGGLRARRRHQHAAYYQSFRSALDTAIGHYRGSVEAAAIDGVSEAAARKIVLERPLLTLDDQGELHCDVTVSVRAEEGLHRLYITIAGPEEVVLYLREQLLTDDLAAELMNGDKVHGIRLETTIAIIVYADRDDAIRRAHVKVS